jgi:hypothetical protein
VYSQPWSAWPRCDHGRLVIFKEAGAEVDIARRVGFVRTEEMELRKTLEKARMTARRPTSTVNVFVVVEYGVSGAEERGSRDAVVVSVITKGDPGSWDISGCLYTC